MLVIRDEQMRALGASSRDNFVARLTDTFTALWPEQVLELGDECGEFLKSVMDRALSYGIETESAVARFINLNFVWGSDFEFLPEHAWAMRILTDPDLDGDAKVHELAVRTGLKLQVIGLNRNVAR